MMSLTGFFAQNAKRNVQEKNAKAFTSALFFK